MNEEMMNVGAEGTEKVRAAGTEEQAGSQGEQLSDGQQQPEKKYTDADVDRIIAKKIAAERKRMQKLFEGEQQESELEKRERNVTRRELMADIKDRLIADGLPSSLASVMDYSDKEANEKSYQDITGIFKEALKQSMVQCFSDKAPRVGRGNDASRDIALIKAFAPPKR